MRTRIKIGYAYIIAFTISMFLVIAGYVYDPALTVFSDYYHKSSVGITTLLLHTIFSLIILVVFSILMIFYKKFILKSSGDITLLDFILIYLCSCLLLWEINFATEYIVRAIVASETP